jgi:hypothetical protein
VSQYSRQILPRKGEIYQLDNGLLKPK